MIIIDNNCILLVSGRGKIGIVEGKLFRGSQSLKDSLDWGHVEFTDTYVMSKTEQENVSGPLSGLCDGCLKYLKIIFD